MNILGLKGELRPFQEEGVQLIDKFRGRALLADEMGLGKTIEALAWLQLHPKLRPAVVVCPAAVKINWGNEIEKWMGPERVTILSGKTSSGMWLQNSGIYILNYAILDSWADKLKALKPKVVIMDEAHYIKNKKADRSRAVRKICKNVKYVLALTGTPIMNRPIEIYNILTILKPKKLPTWYRYTGLFCDRKRNAYGWDISGASNTSRLNKALLKTCMIRRTKEEVLPELPPKTRTVLSVDLDNLEDYRMAEADFIAWLQGKDPSKVEKARRAPFLAQLSGLRRLSALGKMAECLSWTKNFLESGEKLLVGCCHIGVVEIFLEKFPGTLRMDGSTSPKQKQINIDLFNEDPDSKLMVGNLKVLQGMNLHHQCSNMAIIELPMVPGYLDQAEDRLCRMGQARGVNINYLIAAGTVEEKIMRLLDKKREVLSQVLDGKEVETKSLLVELMEEMRS